MPRALKNINLEVGARIKRQRLAQKLTREQLEVERGRSGLSSESIRAFSIALKISCDYLLFGDMSEGYGYLLSKLDAIPQAKRKYVIEIIEAAIQCANTQE